MATRYGRLAKAKVAGSNPVFRSKISPARQRKLAGLFLSGGGMKKFLVLYNSTMPAREQMVAGGKASRLKHPGSTMAS